jgi:hypothetical protein
MENLSCKYCGTECRNSGSSLLGKNGSSSCPNSPTKKHILVPNGSNCVFCGTETRNSGSSLLGKNGSSTCPNSPTKKHQLAE